MQDPSAAQSDGDGTRAPPIAEVFPVAPWLAQAILVAVLCGFGSVQIVDVIVAPPPLSRVKVVVDVVAVVVLFVAVLTTTSARAQHWPWWRRLVALTLAALATYLPLMVMGSQWGGMAGFFGGCALLLLSGWVAWTVFAAVIASMLAVSFAYGQTAADHAYYVAATWDIALMVYGLTRLVQLVRYVHATRAELAQLAIVKERIRFARDLHDLLGYSLSAITLKAELTRRLVVSHPGRARDELAELLDISRQALADVRTVASGYRSISLTKEASSVASLLATAGIDARVEIGCGALEERVDTVLATVLREAVTNLLRHSSAKKCVVKASVDSDAVRLSIVNDGVPRSAVTGRRGGGLENLATRLKAVNGQITAGIRDGSFTVLAEVPYASPKGGIRQAITSDNNLANGNRPGNDRSGNVRTEAASSGGVREGET